MTRKEAIVARRAVRTYTAEQLKDKQLGDLRQFIGTVKPLHSSIKISLNILSREDFCRKYYSVFAPNAPHYIVIRSVEKEGYLENAGFIGEQIVLYLTEQGIGTCWLGMVRPKDDEQGGQLPYVVTICFGRADNAPMRRSPDEAKRKLLHEIVMGKISHPSLLPLLDSGRLAPSSRNSQPVRYITENKRIYVYRKQPLFKLEMLENINMVDIGIALANIYIASDFTVSFVKEASYPTPQSGCVYEYTAICPEDEA